MKAVLVIITAIAFGISCVTGYYLETDMSYGMMIMFGIGDMCVFVLLYRVFFRVFHMKKTACLRGVGGGGKTENCLFNRNTFVKVFAVIFLLWIPLVLIRYPGIQSGGVSAQFQQIMGMDTLARRLSPVIYDGHYISGHHPVLLTFLFGMFIRIGAEAGNVFPVFSGNG